jgi:hypothetical protein
VRKITVTGDQPAISKGTDDAVLHVHAVCHWRWEMTNNFLTLAVLAALGWTFANAPVPEPNARSVASRAIVPEPAVASPIMAASISLEVHQPPVPLVRNARNLTMQMALPAVAVPDSEIKAQDNLDERAAKAAIEADGYKRVSVLGKSSNGTWRAKAYRGSTDVQLTVDSTGRVTAD